MSKIFDPFHTSSSAGDRAGGGLGLPIVRAITEDRGGAVDVGSEGGAGTCFTVTFPVSPEIPLPAWRQRISTAFGEN